MEKEVEDNNGRSENGEENRERKDDGQKWNQKNRTEKKRGLRMGGKKKRLYNPVRQRI